MAQDHTKAAPAETATGDAGENGEDDLPTDASSGVIAPEWLVGFKTSDFNQGTYCAGQGYSTVFTDRSRDTLVVSFDNLSQVREEVVGRSPWGYSFVAKNGWSQLGVMSDNPDWFRNDALIAHLRQLADDGFFARFRKVVMTGTSMGGYAACAFAPLAPGCTVLAFSPQSSLKKDLVPWETRYASGRRADWSGDFADAAVTSQAAKAVYIIYDPFYPEDVAHIDRFTGDNVVRLKARYAGHKTAFFLRRAGALSDVVRTVIETEMTAATFYRIYRQGRNLPWYLNAVRARISAGGCDRLLPAFAATVRKMGFEQIARSAGAVPLPPQHRAAGGGGPAQKSGLRRNGPHEQRLAARAAAGGQPGIPPATGAQPKTQAPPGIEPTVEDRTIDLYARDPALPPLQPAGDLPWQDAQQARRRGLPGSQDIPKP